MDLLKSRRRFADIRRFSRISSTSNSNSESTLTSSSSSDEDDKDDESSDSSEEEMLRGTTDDDVVGTGDRQHSEADQLDDNDDSSSDQELDNMEDNPSTAIAGNIAEDGDDNGEEEEEVKSIWSITDSLDEFIGPASIRFSYTIPVKYRRRVIEIVNRIR